MTVSYFESVQNDMNFYWTKDEVLQRLDTKMTIAFHGVLDMAPEGKGLHARRGLHGRHRPRGQGHAAARLGVIALLLLRTGPFGALFFSTA